LTSSKALDRSKAWGLERPARSHSSCIAVASGVLLGPVVLFGVAGFALWGAFGLLSAAGALLVTLLILKTSTATLSASLAPKPLADPRALNLITGLSRDLEIEPPPAYVVDAPGINALVFWHRGHACLGLTATAVSDLPRTELEAVIAHCLGRLDHAAGGLHRSELRLGGTFGACGSGPQQGDDATAAAITRYPPAVASAIRKAEPVSGRFGYLWFVPEGSGADREVRIAALSDL
jgi:hypothetical protein